MINRVTFLSGFCCFFLTINSYGQKTISSQEFFAPYQKALDKTSKLSRREEIKGEIFSEGKLEETLTIIDEIIMPNKRRFNSVTQANGTVKALELIQIENKFYRKEDNGKWKSEQKWTGKNLARGVPGDAKFEYTVEDIKFNNQPVKLFQMLATHKNEYSPNKDKEPLRYSKLSFWVNKNGMLLKEETNNGFVKPKQIYFLETVVYQYNPSIKIEAPKMN